MAHSWGMRWAPHVNAKGKAYPLHHLHPLHRPITMPAQDGRPARNLMLYVSFGLHTFTRGVICSDADADFYSGDRETRTFDFDRYHHSARLPEIFRTIEQRKLEFAISQYGSVNFVTVELGKGRVRLNTILGHTLRGTRTHPSKK